jgi:heterodisulfide reductase subunit A2
LITYSDLESVEGSPGNFKVKVRKRARSIKMDLCTGCGACVENCPVLYQAKVKLAN